MKKAQEPSNGSMNFSTGNHNSTSKTITWSNDQLTIVQKKGNGADPNQKYISAPRWYKGNVITFTPSQDITISSIIFTFDGSYTPAASYFDVGTYSTDDDNTTWTGSITSSSILTVTLPTGNDIGQVRPTAISYTYISTAADKNTVTYHSNGGTEVASETVFAGETFTEPTAPTKPDDSSYKYTFDCWCTDEQLTTPYNFDTASSGNLDLYAKYTQTEITAADYITNLNTKSQLSYDFSVNMDTLNKNLTGVPGTNYTTATGKTSLTDAVYSFRCAGGNESIQLRSSDNSSGIVTTTSGGHAKRISVTWESHTVNGRTLNVYGSNTAYSAPADLYGDNKGTLLGTIVKNTSTELLIDGDYKYIGLCSDDGAMYLAEVKIYWNSTDKMTISDAKLHFGGLVEKSALEDSSVAASEVGVFVARTSKLNGNAIKDVYTDPTYSSLILSSSIAYADVQSTNEDGTATSGDYAIWQTSLSIPSTKFTEEITAVAWAKSSTGTYTFFTERSFSVVTLAEAYKADNAIYSDLTKKQKASIDYLAALND